MAILEELREKILLFDGGTGSLLQEAGLKPGELPETWNISHPDIVVKLHSDYLEAGCDIIKKYVWCEPFQIQQRYTVQPEGNRNGSDGQCQMRGQKGRAGIYRTGYRADRKAVKADGTTGF